MGDLGMGDRGTAVGIAAADLHTAKMDMTAVAGGVLVDQTEQGPPTNQVSAHSLGYCNLL